MSRRLWTVSTLLAALAVHPAGGLEALAAEAPGETGTIFLRPAPPTATTAALMRRWHRETSGRIGPLLKEWEGLSRAVRERPGRTLAAGCRRLDLALGRLDRDRLPLAPDPSVSLHLQETLRSLSDAADSCAQGAFFLTVWRLRQAETTWRQLRRRLLLYDLTP